MAKLWAAAVALGAGVVSCLAWLDARLKTHPPALQYADTEFNRKVLATCPTMRLPYAPMPFLTNRHVETIFAAKTRSRPSIRYKREILHTPDGGCVALDWEWVEDSAQALPADAPVIILLPGLTGGSGDSYVLHAVASARRAGIRAVVFNSRGTADSPVITPQFYSASFTGDTRAVVAHVASRYPSSRLLAAGWSLGANILLRYLGEEREGTPLTAAVSMCNPFNLTVSNEGLTRGFNRIYDTNLAHSLQRIFAKYALLWTGMPPPFRPDDVPKANTIREFDECITIHSFGWPSVDEYYAGSSSSLSVPYITIPTLCIQALDDPIAPKEATPFKELAANPLCTLVATLTGGHLGWVAGAGSFFGAPWTDQVMYEWLTSVLRELPVDKRKAAKQGAVAANGTARAGAGRGVALVTEGVPIRA